MTYEISVGPAQITVNLGECVLITEQDGQVHQPSERGLFYRDTRLLSQWTIEVDGKPWQLLSSAGISHFACQVVMTNRALPTDDGEIPAGSMSLTLSRILCQGGMRETLTVRNHNRITVETSLAIRMVCDFADIFDVKSHRIVSRGTSETSWYPKEGRLETVHFNKTFRRGLSVSPVDDLPKPVLVDGALCFPLRIEPQGAWETQLDYQAIDGDVRSPPSDADFASGKDSAQAQALDKWRAQATRLATHYTALQQLYDQSLDDLAALRLPITSNDGECFIPAAGIPWFAALFGRDSLITAIQTVPIYPDFARGALNILAHYQATEMDDSRDMQPGKIPHELRRGELAELGLVPYRPYYGTADATPLYIILLHHAWIYSGDRELIEKHLPTAEKCLGWIDYYGDMDGDGFQEYERRTPKGAENQGWKDSGNGVLYENGDNVPAPKALCELQGYVYDAWLRMAAIYDALDQSDKATTLRQKARDLYARFNAVFWDEELQFYAFCLDPQKRRVMSIASNPGHLLWSGIVPPERAAAVVKRLMADDMWSGWGIRTLSSSHPAYNPHDYQLGAIWPHDNGFIALGFKRYGFHDEANRIAKGLIDAGDRFMMSRLPEVFAGTSRSDSPFPVQYLGANVPQAWAAGSVFCFVRAILGPSVDVASRTLYTDAHLPEWLPGFDVYNLNVGPEAVDLRVWRDGDATRVELLRGDGVRLQHRSFSESFDHIVGEAAAPAEPRRA